MQFYLNSLLQLGYIKHPGTDLLVSVSWPVLNEFVELFENY